MAGSNDERSRGPQFARHERKPVEYVGFIFVSVAMLVGGVWLLVLELRGDADPWIIALIMLMLLLGVAGAVVIAMDARDKLRRTDQQPRQRSGSTPTRPYTHGPVIAVDSSGTAYRVLGGAPVGNYVEAAKKRNLGEQESVHPSFPIGKFYIAILMPTVGFFGLLLAIMYFADDSTGLGACACIVTLAAALPFWYVWATGDSRRRQAWVVYANGLTVVDKDGNALRVIRWDEVIEWRERGLLPDPANPPAHPPPYQLLLHFSGGVPALELQGQQIVGIASLRDSAAKAIRRHSPACRGLPRA